MSTEILTFNVDAITPRMMVDFKKVTGESLMELVEAGLPDLTKVSEEVLAGFIWLALRMSGKPDATWDEALDTPFTALGAEEASPVDPPPAG